MTVNEIRKKFLEFFTQKGHTIVASDSLVPKDDPTVLFTTAGMQQFKKQFLGYRDSYTRAATCQKCLRTDDLDVVGTTNFHHTFFEMLGNFSFGDYFKKEAIAWAWEFFTRVLKLPTEKLWVSVYKDDKETEEIWLKSVGLPAAKLVRLGDKSNFWPSDAKNKGPDGPCGPCSEIFFDYGVNPNCKSKVCDPGCDCGRFAEVWNLVFTQFNRKDGGVLEPLPSKNIDTGMGLERLAAVMQGKRSNFETDLFIPIFKAISQYIDSEKLAEVERRIIADHIRAVVFAISDGVVPSNEGRGYVIKKLIIDASDIVVRKVKMEPLIYKLVNSVVEAMSKPYPEIIKKSDDIASVIKRVEDSYIKILKENVPELKQKAVSIFKTQISHDDKLTKLSELSFLYRDTHGLTFPTIISAMTSAISLPSEDTDIIKHRTDELMNQQRERSRQGSKMTGDVFVGEKMELGVPKTEFTGYKHSQSASTILKLYINSKKVNHINKGETAQVILDKSPFYAESGGQIGDTGMLVKDQNRILVTDTQKIEDIFIHMGIVQEGSFKTNDQVHAEIDLQRRLSIMRNHTATHLLQAALREVLGGHVQQQGSLVAEDRLRFDFTHHKPISPEELTEIEKRVNGFIVTCDSVIKEYLPLEKAKEVGALAFFAEKYGSIVRVVTIGDYSKEFCGGTHLDYTGQIGLFKITAETAIAQGIRRLEAKTGAFALNFVREQQQQLTQVSKILKAPVTEILDRVATQTQRIKNLEKTLQELRFESFKNSLDAILNKAENLNGTRLISHTFIGADMDLLRKLSDLIKLKSKSSIIVLGAKSEDNASILVAVTDDLVAKGIKANEVIKDLAPLIDGQGGGRPQLAQAGSRETGKVEHAVSSANRLIKEKIRL